MNFDWEPETQELIDAAGIEVTPAKVNVAVCQWLRQILRHRKYLREVKADPERKKKFQAKQKEYRREYSASGPKGCRREAEDFIDRKIPLRKPVPEDDMYYRMQELMKEKPKPATSDDILVLGDM